MPNPIDQAERTRRVFTHSKERNQKISDGYPNPTEGRNGDVQYRRLGNGIVMFVRDNDGWNNMAQSAGATTDGQINAITTSNAQYYPTGGGGGGTAFSMSELITSSNNTITISGDNPMTGGSTVNLDVITTPFRCAGNVFFDSGDLAIGRNDGSVTNMSIKFSDSTPDAIIFQDGSTSKAEIDSSGNLQIDGDLTVTGNNIIDSGASSGITFDGSGNTAIDGDLTVTGNNIKDGGASSGITFDGSGNTAIDGDLTITGNNIKDGGASSGITFDGSGNTEIDGTLKLSGDDVLSSDGTSVITLSDTDTSGSIDDVTIVADLTVAGDLTVSGGTTTIDTLILNIADTAISIGVVGTPTDTTASDGGIVLKGTTDKTILWSNADDAWKYNQGIFLTSTYGIQFFDSDLLIYSSADGQLDIDADTEIEMTTATLDVDATTLTMDGTTGTIDYTTKLTLDSTTETEMNTALLDVNATTLTMDGTTGTITYTTLLQLDSTTETEMNTALLDVNATTLEITSTTMDVDATTLTMDGTTGTIDYTTKLTLDSTTETEMNTALLDINATTLEITSTTMDVDATTLTMDGTTGTIFYTTKLTLDSTTETEMNTALLDINATSLKADGTTGTISYSTKLDIDSTTEIEMATALLDIDATTLEMDGTTGTISYTTILNLDSTTEIEMATALLDVDATTLEMDGTTGTISYTTILNLDSTTEIEMATALLDVDATTLEMDGVSGKMTYSTILILGSTTEVKIDSALLNVDATSLTMDGTAAVITYPTIDLVASTDIDIDSPEIDCTTQYTDIDIIPATTKAFTIGQDLMSFDTFQQRVGIGTNDPYYGLELYEKSLAFDLIDGDTGIYWIDEADDRMKLYRNASVSGQSDLKLDQWNGSSLITDFLWSNVAILGNTVTAKDSSIFLLQAQENTDEALVVFGAGGLHTSPQWIMGFEEGEFILYDGKNTQYAITVAPNTDHMTLVQDGQKIIFHDTGNYIYGTSTDINLFDDNYSGLISIKGKSDPGLATSTDATITVGYSGGLSNQIRESAHIITLTNLLDTGYVSAGNKFKACEKFFVTGSTDLDLLNYGTIEDDDGVVTYDADFAETFATQTKAIIAEDMVEFRSDGEEADIMSGSAPMAYSLTYRAEYSCSRAGSEISWQNDPNEADQATLNDSDMLYNYTGLGYVTHLKQSASKLIVATSVPGPWNAGAYSNWYDGGLH